jgi:hypothetical protein
VFADDDQQVCDVIVFECACMSVLWVFGCCGILYDLYGFVMLNANLS